MACKDRVRLSNDFIHFTRPFFIRPNVELVYELLGIKSCAEFDGFIELLISSFEAIEWNLNQIDATIASFQNHKHPIGSASKILRLILLGDKVGCPINSSVLLLGKRETLERLELIK